MTAEGVRAPGRVGLAVPADAADLLALQLRVDRQTEHLLVSPGERDPDPARLAAVLAQRGSTGTFGLLARVGDDAAGWCTVDVPRFARAAVTGVLTLAVDAAHQRRGLGAALLAAAEAEARHRGLRRLELTVMRHNTGAQRLYERAGYAHEGVRRACLLVGGRLVDELHMGLLLT